MLRATAAVALAAACAVMLPLVGRLALATYGAPPLRAYAYTDLHNVFFLGPFRELHWPYVRFPFEYHPLLGWTTGLLTLVTAELAFLVLAWGVIVAAAAAITAVLLARLVPARRVAVFWSLAPQLWVLGSLNFDAIPVACMVGAAVAARGSRDVLAGAALGLGTAAKLFPIAALPPLVLARARERRAGAVAAALGAVAVLAAIDGPAIVAPYSLIATGHSPYLLPAANVDSIWTPVSLVLAAVLPPAAIDTVVRLASAGGLVTSYAWLCLRPALRGADPVRLFWVAIVLVLLWSRLYSPQYSLWVLPAFALFAPSRAAFALLAVADVTTWATILAMHGNGASGLLPLLVAGVVARHAALLLLLRRLVTGSGA